MKKWKMCARRVLCLWLNLLVLWLICGGGAEAREPLRLSMDALTQTSALNTLWDFTGPDGNKMATQVPRSWESEYQRLRPLHGTGVYILQLVLPPEARGKSLKLYSNFIAGESFRIYANGKLVGHNGFYAGSSSRVALFEPFVFTHNPLELRVVVSNQVLHWSGLVNPLYIGTTPAIEQLNYRHTLQTNLLFAIFAFLAFFHLVLYFFYREDRSVFWFGLLCFSTCVFMEFFVVHNLEYLFGDIPIALGNRMMRVGLYATLPCFFRYAYSLSSAFFSKRAVSFFSWVNAGFLLTALLPGKTGPWILLWFGVLLMAICYSTWRLLHLLNKSDIRPFVFSGLLYLGTVLNDLLNGLSLLHTGFQGRLGFLLFCLTQSGFLGWRLQKNYRQSIQLKNQLQAVNHNLEDLVATRTEELNKKNEELNELLHFKEEMVEMLAHDLKTPLNVLLSLPENRSEDHDSVQAASLRMKQLIENMTNVNQAENAEIQLQLSTCGLQALLQGVVNSLQLWASQRRIQIANLVPADVTVQVDVFLFERVIQNLLDNALKHAPPQSEITLSSQGVDGMLWLDIQDSGPGMPPEMRTQALAKGASFARHSTPASSGLGLYFCRQVMRAHQGNLELLSSDSGGLRVRLHLPGHGHAEPALFHWQSDPLQQLAPYARSLQAYRVYQISQIKPILRELSQLQEPQAQRWVAALTESIKEVNETQYRQLIDQITSHPGD
ncbi:MAG: ATP-binding protein [Candidatus Sericytochromatia bacterium]